jgi:hypothetical protein
MRTLYDSNERALSFLNCFRNPKDCKVKNVDFDMFGLGCFSLAKSIC